MSEGEHAQGGPQPEAPKRLPQVAPTTYQQPGLEAQLLAQLNDHLMEVRLSLRDVETKVSGLQTSAVEQKKSIDELLAWKNQIFGSWRTIVAIAAVLVALAGFIVGGIKLFL